MIAYVCALAVVAGQPAWPPEGGSPVIGADALTTVRVGGLERTQASAEVLREGAVKLLRVTIRAEADDTNATQLTIPTSAAVSKGDVLLAIFNVRGVSADGKSPARMMFLFERSTNPWTKSIGHGAISRRPAQAWRTVAVPFVSAESYSPGQAMASLRFAFGPQRIDVADLRVLNYGRGRTLEALQELAAAGNAIGATTATLRRDRPAQKMVGLGGNFCQARYGRTEPIDPVGSYNLTNLRVAHARVGIPLNYWTPEEGVYREDGQARAAFVLMQDLTRRKIPIVGSVWEGPTWMLGGRVEQMGRTLPESRYDACIEAVGRFLVRARDGYGVTVDYFSFNEPDYGVNFRFTPSQMAAFIRRAGPKFRALGLKTRFLVGDTAGGSAAADYCRGVLRDASIAPYLGPIAFHCWDALSASEASYRAIAELGKETGRPVWCLEAGHDAALWQQPNPWKAWENALRTALAYERTLRLTGSEVMDYWTYQDNYPLVESDGSKPFPVFHVMAQMTDVFAPGSRIVVVETGHDELFALAAVGPETGRTGVLLVNPAGPATVAVAGLPAGRRARVETSTAARQRSTQDVAVGRDGRLSVQAPPRSVVTIVTR